MRITWGRVGLKKATLLDNYHLSSLFTLLLFTQCAFAQSSTTIPTSASSVTSLSSTTASSTGSSTLTSSPSPSATPILSISGLPVLITLPTLNATHRSIRLAFPSTDPLYITLNILSSIQTNLTPTALVSTSSPISFDLGSRSFSDPSSGGVLGAGGGANRQSRAGGTWLMQWDKGFGNWTSKGNGVVGVQMLIGLGLLTDGTLDSSVVVGDGNVVIQLGASSSGPISSLSPALPLLGDTTSSSALIFSPLLEPFSQIQPTYPNYTLPGPQLVFPPLSSSTTSAASSSTSDITSDPSSFGSNPNLTLIMVPTSSSPTNDGLGLSLPAILAANLSTGGVASQSNIVFTATSEWMSVGGSEGYRSFWVVGNLVAGTNYTAWVLDVESGRLSQPIWLQTKESGFPCQLVLPTSLCPSIGYSAPVPANTTSLNAPITNLPDSVVSILTSSLEAFSTSLLSTPCGRDMYSQISTCLDCYTSYRDWLCRVVIPQCASNSTAPSTSARPTPLTVYRNGTNPRNPLLASIYTYDYDELLPCMSVCNAVDRTCPVTIGFGCPVRGKNAAKSYGFIGGDDDKGDGSVDGGITSSDQWGGRWCNGPD